MLGPRNELFDAAKYRLLADQLGCPDERWCSEGKWRSKSGPSLADLSTCWRRMEPDDSIQPMEQGRMPKAMRREELEEGELEEGELEEGELEEEAIDVSDYLPMAHQDARTPGRDARYVCPGSCSSRVMRREPLQFLMAELQLPTVLVWPADGPDTDCSTK